MALLEGGFGTAPFGIPGWEQTTDGTPLVARCMVLTDGRTRLAVVSGTYLTLGGEEVALVREAVGKALGLPAESVLLAGTHVHSGPPTLTPEREERLHYARHIAQAAAIAAGRAAVLQPLRWGVATARLPGVSRVRRILRRDGTVITLRRACPETWGWATDPETVGPEEPLDDLLTVLRFEGLDGTPVGAVMHFTCHPLPDFLGYAARLVEQTIPDLTCLILNGCLGSVDTPFEIPIRGRTQAAQLPVLGDILGYRTLELLARAEVTDAVQLGHARRPVFLPMEPRFRANPLSQSTLLREAVARGGFETEVQCLRLGQLALVGVPGEPHVGFGTAVTRVSPFELTRVVGVANRSCAYLLPEESRARGGYEADPRYWSMVTGAGLATVLQAAEACLAEMA
jgi:hypothetical protein